MDENVWSYMYDSGLVDSFCNDLQRDVEWLMDELDY